jgi:hypothetical protein
MQLSVEEQYVMCSVVGCTILSTCEDGFPYRNLPISRILLYILGHYVIGNPPASMGDPKWPK